MKQFTIGKNDSAQRLDKFVTKSVPALTTAQLYKYIRLKRIKVNGKKCEISYKLNEGDLIEMYLNDELFVKPDSDSVYKTVKHNIEIVYEDEHILLVDKRPGVVVHDDDEGTRDTLINHIKSYLDSTGAWDARSEHSFVPSLCNRIDRGTGGIVISAKTAEALRTMNEKIRENQVDKYYLCLVFGTLPKKEGVIKNYIWKDAKQNRVYCSDVSKPGSKTAITEYKVLGTKKGVSLVECHLLTGRTHQIRAQMASIGCPLLGDTKYGTNRQNDGIPFKSQALYSYKLTFCFTGEPCALEYLNGKCFKVEPKQITQYWDKL